MMVVAEETDSTLTHAEIEECAKRYNLTSWQQVFALDAEFWSLITVEKEEKDKAAKKKASGADDSDFITVDEDAEKSAQTPQQEVPADGPSISLAIFMNYTPSLADKFKDVN